MRAWRSLFCTSWGWVIETCAAVYSLDEHWNGHGLPDHLVARGHSPAWLASARSPSSLISFAASIGSRQSAGDPRRSLRHLGMTRTWSAPRRACMGREFSGRSACRVLTPTRCSQPCSRSIPGSSNALAARDIDLICSGFADVVDAKSPFTYRHSVGTTEVAVLISNAVELAPDRVNVVRRAALLHDIGMLGVPNTILDKQGPLTPKDWKAIHRHSALSREILSRVRAFSEIAVLAGQHHEKLDGTGIPLTLLASNSRSSRAS